MNDFLKDILTTRNGEDYDLLKVAVLFGIVTLPLVALYDVDPLNYGGGFGAIIAAGGFGLKAKAKTEPGGEG